MAPSGRGLREAVGEPAHVWVMVFFWLFKRTDKLQFYSSLYPKFATVAALSLQFSLTLTQRFR